MKWYGLFGVLVVAVIAAVVFVQAPATAQQSPVESSWEIYPVPYSDSHVLVVKHNRVTGHTLLLSCYKACGGGEEWRDYPVEE